ncbi:DUF5983 family protein [Pseudomonas mosselii]
MEVLSLPVICTNHLTEEVAKLLTENCGRNPWVPCAAWESGYFISFLGIQDKVQNGVDVPQCLRDIAFWLSGKDLTCSNGDIKWNATWVHFDQSADEVEGLPVYKW